MSPDEHEVPLEHQTQESLIAYIRSLENEQARLEKIEIAAVFAFRNRALASDHCWICAAKWIDGGHDVSNHKGYCGYRAIKEAIGNGVWIDTPYDLDEEEPK